MSLTIGSLFSGIGGLELGLERATGADVLWQVEQNLFCRRVLERHWPHATRHDDVRAVRFLPYVDIMCGGFPCQDISSAGLGAGLDGARSGLWWEYARIIGETKPTAVIIENVAALATRGLDRVLSTLADLGYMGRWDMVSAASVGAPHLRRRIFITATHPDRVRCARVSERHGESSSRGEVQQRGDPDGCSLAGPTADANKERTVADLAGHWWESRTAPSAVRGVDDGIRSGVDGPRRRRPANDKHRLHALGNAVVPHVAERIGRQLMQILKGTP